MWSETGMVASKGKIRASAREIMAWNEESGNGNPAFTAHLVMAVSKNTLSLPWMLVQDTPILHIRLGPVHVLTKVRLLPSAFVHTTDSN